MLRLFKVTRNGKPFAVAAEDLPSAIKKARVHGKHITEITPAQILDYFGWGGRDRRRAGKVLAYLIEFEILPEDITIIVNQDKNWGERKNRTERFIERISLSKYKNAANPQRVYWAYQH